MYGKIEYNEEGLPKCELCGRYFKRVLNHVRMSHGDMNEKDYKRQFGFDVTKGICSKESSELSRMWNKTYSKVVIDMNLLQDGRDTRFKKGSKGRTRDKISAATMMRLKQQSFIKKQL